MKLKMSILLLMLLMTITPALAFDSLNTACEGCHAYPPVFLNNTVSISQIQVTPGQTFPVTITWTGGVTVGTNTVAKWPNAVLDNALFNPTPQISPVGVFPTGSLISTLTAPNVAGNYTLKAYAADGTGTPNSGKETDFKVITVQVTQPATSAIDLTKTPSATQVTSGTSVTYTYVVKNTGGTILNNVLVEDNILGSIGGPITLNAGANQTFTKSQVLTTNTTNIGTAKGTDPSGNVVTSNVSATVLVIVSPPPSMVSNISGFKINAVTGKGIPGWSITLTSLAPNNTFFQMVNTTADGSYKFTNLTNGIYKVTEGTVAGWTPVGPTTLNVSINGSDVKNLNFTNTPSSTLGSISGFKINAVTGKGIPGWTIILLNTDTGIKKVMTTSADGSYTFENLPAGSYLVKEKLRNDFKHITNPVIHINLSAGEKSVNNNFTNIPKQKGESP